MRSSLAFPHICYDDDDDDDDDDDGDGDDDDVVVDDDDGDDDDGDDDSNRIVLANMFMIIKQNRCWWWNMTAAAADDVDGGDDDDDDNEDCGVTSEKILESQASRIWSHNQDIAPWHIASPDPFSHFVSPRHSQEREVLCLRAPARDLRIDGTEAVIAHLGPMADGLSMSLI